MADQQSDDELLQAFGRSAIRNFIAVVVSTWVMGLYTWLVIKAGTILLQKERRRRRTAILTWSVVLAMYLIKLTLWFIDARQVIASYTFTLVDISIPSLAARQRRSDESLLRLSVVEDVLYAYMTVLGDAIVMWRVYAFWRGKLEFYALALPGIIYLASIICAGLVTYCAAQSSADLFFGAFSNPHFCRNIQATSYWVQFSMAMVATTLIGVKTWNHRRMVKTLIGNQVSWRSPVNRAMLIMLDSGVLYSLFFLVEAVLGVVDLSDFVADNPARQFVTEIYQYQTSTIVGIYPTIIVILVHSHTQSLLIDSDGSYAVSTLQFESSRSQRATDINFNSTRATGWTHDDSTGDAIEVRSRRANGGSTGKYGGHHHHQRGHSHPPEISLHELRTMRSSAGEDEHEYDEEEEVESKDAVKVTGLPRLPGQEGP